MIEAARFSDTTQPVMFIFRDAVSGQRYGTKQIQTGGWAGVL
jgi:hypothetical protein